MSSAGDGRAELVLSGLADVMFRMVAENYQKHLAEIGLTMVQAQVLRLLESESRTTSEIAAGLGISAPAVTQLTDRLNKKRLIERREAPGDRRSVLVVVTARGRRALDRFRERRNQLFLGALGKVTPGDLDDIVASLGKVIEALQKCESETAVAANNASNNCKGGKTVAKRRRMSN